MINIVVAGAKGKMGAEAVRMVQAEKDFSLAAAVDLEGAGKKMKDIDGMEPLDVPVYTDMQACLDEVKADVLIDLTSPGVGKKHMQIAIENGVRPVVGTTGFSEEDVEELSQLAAEKQIGAVIAPNFAIGAVLLMKFSQLAAKYMPDVEIIEQHHDKKLDAPSGTAVKTAQMISEVRDERPQGHPDEEEQLSGVRGGEHEGMHIHSVRLPGLVAHQEVIFGGEGQTLTVRHDSLNRTSFMPGIKLACQHVMTMSSLVYGLEQLLDI
ncbi:4-hydroxy-tetrahydrodipicolinate reductase [Salisediminibacterium halotolerans]|uniref:4-hydroxy-tetrahydrodipicolinate reductase n=1 Tax=Salisediminibacterium halotolerans TaxID=517425 RepID=UPI000F23C011|nr:4-hydroxy-tetrahydrodipicolinate reductase [Salisediminibacterium halotolerans]RLJ77920.1 dihydrodipicolinate reductase [Actinophytocola xinjiangensis]RPE88742.1 dihydrodipicolinate reductase [Salisediminibacterium halotolerans]TWG36897.1 dihydrodipicolinate reductase [Salisediminibacterium halotolerans]GEL07417.1 4-hydroxy-tetrahydrodipicolinate reductase [Salisediminibacterium halotolerans]